MYPDSLINAKSIKEAQWNSVETGKLFKFDEIYTALPRLTFGKKRLRLFQCGSCVYLSQSSLVPGISQAPSECGIGLLVVTTLQGSASQTPPL